MFSEPFTAPLIFSKSILPLLSDVVQRHTKKYVQFSQPGTKESRLEDNEFSFKSFFEVGIKLVWDDRDTTWVIFQIFS